MLKRGMIILLMFLGTQLSYSQIKLHSNGNVSIGTYTAPSTHNTIYLYGPRLTFGGYAGRTFKFDCSPQDPRWWSSTNKIVFYNTEQYTHCDVQARSFMVASDERYKTEITKLDNALDKVLNLNGVSYFWKSDNGLKSITKRTPTYGFIAQQVETVIPDVVTTDSLGYKVMDYLGVIPYVVESIKELNQKIETQDEYIQELEAQVNYPSISGKNLIEQRNQSKLLANQPNPFKDKTSIGYYISSDANQALIAIYDLNGKQLLAKKISNFGSGEINISAEELVPGIYLYSLIVDGIDIDTKKMVVLE